MGRSYFRALNLLELRANTKIGRSECYWEVRMFKYIFRCFLLFAISACSTTDPIHSDKSEKIIFDVKEKDIGRIIRESSNPLENDFYDVSRSIENPPSHWEGIGHFGFIFYRQKEICKCSPYNTSMSPDGRYLLYSNTSKDGILEVFDSHNLTSKALSEIYIGYPINAEWSADGTHVLVHLDKYESVKTSRTFRLKT